MSKRSRAATRERKSKEWAYVARSRALESELKRILANAKRRPWTDAPHDDIKTLAGVLQSVRLSIRYHAAVARHEDSHYGMLNRLLRLDGGGSEEIGPWEGDGGVGYPRTPPLTRARLAEYVRAPGAPDPSPEIIDAIWRAIINRNWRAAKRAWAALPAVQPKETAAYPPCAGCPFCKPLKASGAHETV